MERKTASGIIAAVLALSLSALAGTSAAADSSNAGQAGSSGAQTNQGAANKTGQTAKSPKSSGMPVVVYTLIPIKVAEQDQSMKGGCWARLHDDQNFEGDMLTLIGPVDMPDMTGPFGIDWKGKISSVETGPKATMQVYDNENYNDLVSTFKPGQKVTDVSKKMGFFDEFSSLKISCGK